MGADHKHITILFLLIKKETSMAEQLTVVQGDKIAQYETLVPQIAALLKDEPNWVARMANVSAALKTTFLIGFG